MNAGLWVLAIIGALGLLGSVADTVIREWERRHP